MTQFLPPNLLALFAPRDPIPYLPPPDKLPHEKKNVHVYQGIAQFVVGNFEDPAETPPPTRVETKEERYLFYLFFNVQKNAIKAMDDKIVK